MFVFLKWKFSLMFISVLHIVKEAQHLLGDLPAVN